ncbi:MAG: hypothetical protein K9L61_03680 [Candidatus Omnitrophica bacterium]|nr:hypothetical protein [Candidatus Omnitrophota bacterium]
MIIVKYVYRSKHALVNLYYTRLISFINAANKEYDLITKTENRKDFEDGRKPRITNKSIKSLRIFTDKSNQYLRKIVKVYPNFPYIDELEREVKIVTNKAKRLPKTNETTWNNHIIKIEVRKSSKFWNIDDFFVYVDEELIAQTNREKAYEILQSYKQQKIRMPKDERELIIKNVKSKIAEGFFDHEDQRIPIKVQQKFRFREGETFIVTINEKEIGTINSL